MLAGASAGNKRKARASARAFRNTLDARGDGCGVFAVPAHAHAFKEEDGKGVHGSPRVFEI